MAMTDLELDVELLKKEVDDMLAVHEEKISQQEEIHIRDAQNFASDVKELHSRITTSTKEMTELMTKQHTEAEAEIRRLREDVTARVGVLERWKYLIIGGSIVVGFVLNAYMKHIM